MSAVAIIPVRSFSTGKQRLSPVIDETTRASLGRALTDHVATTAAEIDLVPLIVTKDPAVADWSVRTGFPIVEDPGTGLDGAVMAGIAWAAQSHSGWLVIHSDLPLLRREDLERLSVILETGQNPIAPSVDGGTSAMGGTTPIETAYGPASFHRHLKRLPSPVVVVTVGLALDIDSPQMLLAAGQNPRGSWLARYLE